MDKSLSKNQQQTTLTLQVDVATYLDVAPEHWRQRILDLLKTTPKEANQTEELRLALLVMDALSFQILSLQGAAREDLALRLLRAGSFKLLTRKAIAELGAELSDKTLVAPSLELPAQIETTQQKRETIQTQTGKAVGALTPEKPGRFSALASYVRQATGFNPISPRGDWMHLSVSEFDKHVATMTGGKTYAEVCEIVGVVKLSDEARRRYKLAEGLENSRALSAALLVVAEYLLERQKEKERGERENQVSSTSSTSRAAK